MKAAFDLTAEAAENGLVQSQTQFQPSWNSTIANDKLTAISCPPSMLGTLKGNSKPEAKGKSAVATAPKAGNWAAPS
ncbi:Carbohydrate ABC transporter substrate-binding protein OS=Streptomyces alboniger OX=132473 GN=CP975_12565 PE=4 SV=1 [Streptomyces alboniger]